MDAIYISPHIGARRLQAHRLRWHHNACPVLAGSEPLAHLHNLLFCCCCFVFLFFFAVIVNEGELAGPLIKLHERESCDYVCTNIEVYISLYTRLQDH